MNKVLSFAFLFSFIMYGMDQNPSMPKDQQSSTTNPKRYFFKKSYEEHKGSIDSLTFNPADSNELISNSSDGTIKFWSLKSDQNKITVCKDILGSKCAVSQDGNFIAYGDSHNKIKIIDRKNFSNHAIHGPVIDTESIAANGIEKMAFHPKNNYNLISALRGGEYNSRITFFNLESDKKTVLNTECVYDFALDPSEGKTLVVASIGRSKMYNIETQQPIYQFDDTERTCKVMFNASNHNECAFFNSTENCIRIFDLHQKKSTKIIRIRDNVSNTQDIVFCPNGKQFLLTTDNQTHIFDAETGALTESLPNITTTLLRNIALKLKNKSSETPIKTGAHTSKMKGSTVSPDGKTIATWSQDNTIKIWKQDI